MEHKVCLMLHFKYLVNTGAAISAVLDFLVDVLGDCVTASWVVNCALQKVTCCIYAS